MILSVIFKEEIEGYKSAYRAVFGDKDPEKVVKEIDSAMQDLPSGTKIYFKLKYYQALVHVIHEYEYAKEDINLIQALAQAEESLDQFYNLNK